MLTQLQDLLLFRAFRPHEMDVGATLAARLAGKRILGVAADEYGATLAAMRVSASGDIGLVAATEHSAATGEALTAAVKAFVDSHRLRYAVVLQSGALDAVSIEPLNVTGANAELSTEVRKQPGRYFSDLDPDHVYSVIPHADFPTALRFSFTPAAFHRVCEAIEQAGCRVALAQNGAYCLLQHWMSQSRGGLLQDDRPVLVIDSGTILLILCRGGEWRRVGFRVHIHPDDLAEKTLELLARYEFDSAQLAIIASGDWDAAPTLRERYPELEIEQYGESTSSASLVAAGRIAGVDIRATPPATRPRLPSRYRAWGIIGYAVFGIICLAWGASFFIEAHWNKAASKVDEDNQRLQSEVAQIQESTRELAAARDEFRALGEWAKTNHHAQQLLVLLFEDHPANIRMESVQAQLAKGMPQLTLTMQFSGPLDALATRVRAINERLDRHGYELVQLKQSATRSGAVYESTYLLPVLKEAVR
ncbi:MAG: hypothetical protein ACQKBV_12405 [Puniceicoccales bacterium]